MFKHVKLCELSTPTNRFEQHRLQLIFRIRLGDHYYYYYYYYYYTITLCDVSLARPIMPIEFRRLLWHFPALPMTIVLLLFCCCSGEVPGEVPMGGLGEALREALGEALEEALLLCY